LWKRIPVAAKNGNAELEQMHKIFLCLCKNDVIEFYKLLDAFKWSKSVSEIMYELKEKVRMDTIDLIGRAYTSIFENVFGEMTNLSQDMIEDTCKRMNWQIQEGPSPRLIFPKKPLTDKVSTLNAEDQLQKLTSFVSFLEN
jgi:COP9 signalosome complex subunit 8